MKDQGAVSTFMISGLIPPGSIDVHQQASYIDMDIFKVNHYGIKIDRVDERKLISTVEQIGQKGQEGYVS